jgi:membrane-associated phospholipid phosphatase
MPQSDPAKTMPPQVDLPSRTAVCVRWAGGLAAALVVLGLLARHADLPLAVFLHDNVSASTDRIFDRIGRLGDAGGLYAAVALVVYGVALVGARRGWPVFRGIAYDRMARSALFMLAVLAVGGVITAVLKQAVARARPDRFFESAFYGLADSFSGKPFTSFPSSHALTGFAVAATLAIVAPVWRWPALIVAILVGASRLVTLDHYASDVVAAGLIAFATAYVLAPCFMDTRRAWPTRLPWRWFGTKGRA